MLRTLSIAVVSLGLFAAPALAKPTTWEIDPAHTTVSFAVKHLMVSTVRGVFGKVAGKVVLDPDNLAASNLEATIDATTIDTREPKRDAHLKSPDFFDIAKFPTLTFKSKKIAKAGKGFKVTGDLTIHGVTKEVVLDVEPLSAPVKSPFGTTAVGTTATTTINREDFGLKWNKALEAGGVLVGKEVKITLDVELVEKPAA
jgi:polyisoprenoid-binding protein YceI